MKSHVQLFLYLSLLPLSPKALDVDALPQGANVTAGNIEIVTQQNAMTIQQSSERGIIEYDDFSVGVNQTVNFQQPSSQSVTLNRVVGNNPSDIFGRIQSNGQILLVNPNGVFFSNSAQLNVGSLVTSTLNITDENFAENRWQFEGSSSAAIENKGSILSRDGGYIALIGNNLINSGDISSENGHVGLLSGNRVVLGFEDDVIAYDVTEFADTAKVHNSGNIKGDLGVTLDIQSLDDIETIVVNNEGVIQASGFELKGGEIIISSRSGGIVNSGTINTDSNQNDAGKVKVQSERFVNYGTITASAQKEGAGGSINIHTSDALYLADGSLTEANGAGKGNGGTLIHYSDNAAWFAPEAHSNARAGEAGGNGGFIEMSGKQYINYAGQVDTTANNGENGLVLIDPSNINILDIATPFVPPGVTGTTININPIPATSNIATSTIEQTLLSGNSVRISTANTNTPGDVGTLTVSSEIDLTGITGQSLTLQSNSDMFVNANICASNGAGGCASGTHDTNIALSTVGGDGGSIFIADDIILNSGTNGMITMNADANITFGENSSLISGNPISILLIAGDRITLPDSGMSTNLLNVITDDIVSRSSRQLNIDANSIAMRVNNPQGDLTINGQIYALDLSLGATANVNFNPLHSPANQRRFVDIRNIDLANGDFFASVQGGTRATDLRLSNYTNVNNISLINPTIFGNVFLPLGVVGTNGDFTIQSDSIRTVDGSRTYSIRANTLDLQTRASGGGERLMADVNTLRLNYSPASTADTLTINEADTLVVDSITQTGESDLTINSNDDITFNNQINLSNIGTSQHRFTVNSSNGSILLNTDITDPNTGQTTDTLISLDAANDIIVASNTRTLSNNGSITLNAGNQVSIGDSALIDSGNALLSLNANSITNSGTLNSDSTNTQAITLSSNTDLSESGPGILQAQNGGMTLRAETGIDVSTYTAYLDIQNSTSGGINIRETDSLTLTNIATPSDAVFTLNSGNLIIPDVGITVSGRLTLEADSITTPSNTALEITADELIFSANALSNDVILNTNVNAIDTSANGQNLTITNQDTLNILDLNGDGNALEVNNGNLMVETTTGSIVINDRVSVRDTNADGNRTGLASFHLNSGDFFIGNIRPTSIEIDSLLDNATLSSLNTPYSSNAVILINQNVSNETPTQLEFGNNAENSVNINVRGGDIVVDFYDEVSKTPLNSILLNNGVNFNVGNSDSEQKNGALFASGVDTSLANFIIGRENNIHLIREPNLLPNILDILNDTYPPEYGSNSAESESSQSENDSHTISSLLGSKSSDCELINDDTKQKNCKTEQAYRRFFHAFLISEQLPILEKNVKK